MSAVDRLHAHWMPAQRSWNSGLPMRSAVRRFRVSVEFAAGRSAICLRMSWLVWAETSPPIKVDSRTWRAMSCPVVGGGWLGTVVLSSVVRSASEYLARAVFAAVVGLAAGLAGWAMRARRGA